MRKQHYKYLLAPLVEVAVSTLTVSAQVPSTSFFSDLLAVDPANIIFSFDEIVFRLIVAVALSAILVFRPHKNIPLFQRNLYVAQTQILLAVVAAALMMIVGDNAARAFGIFAAVSVVRFRTNIRDPKEITVLLISLALGLSAGVGRWELGLALCIFAITLLWMLERNEPGQVFRAMELKIKTNNAESAKETINDIFRRYKLETEVREVEPNNPKNDVAKITYYLNLPLNISTNILNDKIMAAMPGMIEGIEWEQEKHSADIYQ